MEVEVRLFAPYKAVAGKEKVSIILPAGAATVDDVLAELQRSYPGLREMLAPVPGRSGWCPAAVLVGDLLVEKEHPVRDGTVVCLVPAIVGG